MPQDKQLGGVRLDDVLERRRLDQALNAKEFAVLAGISYSTAREWFRAPGFPVMRGFVFWADFVEWRRAQTGLTDRKLDPSPKASPTPVSLKTIGFPARAARILAEAG